jgi:hypothetical protein
MSKFVIFRGPYRSEFCILGFIKGFENNYKLSKGHSVAKEWPDDVTFLMDPDFKKRIKLSDNLVNGNGYIIASPKLQDFLKKKEVPNIEFLPVQIVNHKKKVETTEYALVNQVTMQDCVDTKKSDLVWNKINPDDVSIVKKLVLNEGKVDPRASLFRMKHVVDLIIVRRDLADAITAEGFTGIEFIEIDEYEPG